MDLISINYDQAEIERMSADDKLTLLLKIAFANQDIVAAHQKTLFGNGQEGLCDIVRSHSKGIKFLYSLFLLAAGGIMTMLFTHISGK